MLRRIHGDKVAGSKLLIEARGPMFRRLRELFQSRETLPPRQAYRPILTPLGDGRVEQTFSATHIQVELRPDLAQLALSEASPHGTIHGLILTVAPNAPKEFGVELEFNRRGFGSAPGP
jgi:hypothetical protein